MSYARSSGALLLRQNEGPPGKRIARPREPFYDQLRLWGYQALDVRARAQHSIQVEVDGGVAARVDLEPLLELEGNWVFVQVWPQPLLDRRHSTLFFLPSSVL